MARRSRREAGKPKGKASPATKAPPDPVAAALDAARGEGRDEYGNTMADPLLVTVRNATGKDKDLPALRGTIMIVESVEDDEVRGYFAIDGDPARSYASWQSDGRRGAAYMPADEVVRWALDRICGKGGWRHPDYESPRSAHIAGLGPRLVSSGL